MIWARATIIRPIMAYIKVVLGARHIAAVTTGGDVLESTVDNHYDGYYTDYD